MNPQRLGLSLLLALFLVAWQARRTTCPTTHKIGFAYVLALVGILSITACGGSGGHNVGTPKGTSTLTVTGTSGGVSHNLNLTLTVN
jgi:hypothetical protein